MIIGHGIDLQELSAIRSALNKGRGFEKRVLTTAELNRFESLSDKRKIEYLAGRWAAKEALVKALGTGIGKYSFQNMEVLNDSKGAPYFNQAPTKAKIWLSISHSANFVQASVILEEGNERK